MFQVITLDKILAQATQSLIYGRPDCTDLHLETDDLTLAVTKAAAVGGMVKRYGEHFINALDVQLAGKAIGAFRYDFGKHAPAQAGISVQELYKRMNDYELGNGH